MLRSWNPATPLHGARACEVGGNTATGVDSEWRSSCARRYNIAVCLLIQEKYQEASAELSQAIALDPAISMFYTTRGWAQRKCGNFAAAIHDYILAKRVDSKVRPTAARARSPPTIPALTRTRT